MGGVSIIGKAVGGVCLIGVAYGWYVYYREEPWVMCVL